MEKSDSSDAARSRTVSLLLRLSRGRVLGAACRWAVQAAILRGMGDVEQQRIPPANFCPRLGLAGGV